MSIQLPSTDSPIRERFDVAHVVETLRPENRSKLPAFGQIKSRISREGLGEGVHSINVICMKADGSICLVEFGPRGGAKQIWRFC